MNKNKTMLQIDNSKFNLHFKTKNTKKKKKEVDMRYKHIPNMEIIMHYRCNYHRLCNIPTQIVRMIFDICCCLNG